MNRLLTAMQGVAAVSNLGAATGGYDAETDAALYARLSAFRREPATSGNIHQYEQWALEVDGVGAARAIDLWNGPGTVKVVLAGNGLEPVDETAAQRLRHTSRASGRQARRSRLRAQRRSLSILRLPWSWMFPRLYRAYRLRSGAP